MIELDRINLGLVHEHQYDETTGIYRLNRIYGICSNIMVAIHGIAKTISMGYSPKQIELILAEYITSANLHPLFFTVVHRKVDKKMASAVCDDLYPSTFGLSKGWEHFDKNLIQRHMPTLQALMHYFSPSWVVKDQMLKYFSLLNIDFQKTTFIWARGTDKSKEAELPSVSDYVHLALRNSPTNRTLVQTDDAKMANEFRNHSSVSLLNELPFCSTGFHNSMDKKSDIEFIKDNKMTKIEYVSRFLALMYIAAQAKIFIGYPGNMTSMIPILRGTFEGCFLFKNSRELF